MNRLLAFIVLNWLRIRHKTEFYQPTFNSSHIPLFPVNQVDTHSKTRLRFIESSLDFSQIGSYLDIGSQLGYFVFTLSQKHSLSAHGLDHDYYAVLYARALAQLHRLKNVSFSFSRLTPESAKQLPSFDLVSFLNVFHHLVYHQGFKAADLITKTLIGKSRFFVFETGQATESDLFWSSKLKFMGQDPHAWITKYLSQNHLTIMSSHLVPTHLSHVKRRLYICRK